MSNSFNHIYHDFNCVFVLYFSASLGSHTISTQAATSQARQRKFSIGSMTYHKATGQGQGHSPHKVKRKLSDGHVHWADEFQKDLARTHPRKHYTRHPSHCPHSVKPILKHDDHENEHEIDDCVDEENDDEVEKA